MTAFSYLQQLACDPYDYECGVLRIDAGFLLLFYEATEGVEGAYGTEFLPAAVAFFRDDDDAHADG